jgi:hypothetical protein
MWPRSIVLADIVAGIGDRGATIGADGTLITDHGHKAAAYSESLA